MQVTNGNEHSNFNQIANKIYLQSSKAVGSKSDLLNYIVSSYKNILRAESFDAGWELLQVSRRLLNNQKVEESKLMLEYDSNFKQVWKLHSELIGNLKDCIEMVINNTKKKISERFLESSQEEHPQIFKSNAKVAIMSIKVLSEMQFKIDKKLSFKGILRLYKKNINYFTEVF